jgi:hypothetical protein
MSTDLNLTGLKYNIAAAVLFVRFMSTFVPLNAEPSRSRTAWLRSPRMFNNKRNVPDLIFIGTSHSSYSDHRAGVSSPPHSFPSLPNIDPVPTIMVAWGLVMTLMCLVNSFQSLVVCVKRIFKAETNKLTSVMVELDCSLVWQKQGYSLE